MANAKEIAKQMAGENAGRRAVRCAGCGHTIARGWSWVNGKRYCYDGGCYDRARGA